MPSEIDPFRLQMALLFFAFHWLLLILLQIESFLLYVKPKGGQEGLGHWLLLAPLLQTENILVAAFAGGLAYWAAPSSLGRWIYLTGYVVLTAFVVADQMYYKRFFHHFRPTTVEGGEFLSAPLLLGSVWNELAGVFWLNVSLACCGLLFLACVLADVGLAVGAVGGLAIHPIALTVLAGLLALAGLPAAFTARHHNLQRHALLVLLHDLVHRRPTAQRIAGHPIETGGRPTPEAGPHVDPFVTAAAAAIRGQTRKPNVLLIVLESVGANQLFSKNGRLDPEQTPHLSELIQHGLIFQTVYSPYPSTVQTCLALHTGGVHPTIDSMSRICPHAYPGPTLARHFGAHGYRTAFFSCTRIDFDGMDELAEQMGYQLLFHPSQEEDRLVGRNLIHGWALSEDFTLDRLEPWLEESADAGSPFFAMYWTGATHHPYGAPPEYLAPFYGDDLVTRYRNALHYTDASIQRLMRFLRDRDLSDNTIVAVMGDHGEAFGTVHPGNFFHANHLFEENVRSFLMLMSPVAPHGPVFSSRLGHCGDVFPTLADLAGLPAPRVPGKSLCARELEPRFVFFFTFSGTERWGLRDGQWKFIQAIDGRSAELYNLARDPTEQENLAGQHADRVRGYEARCQEWFLRANEDYRARVLEMRKEASATAAATWEQERALSGSTPTMK